ERMALWIQTDTGIDIACVQVAGLVARRVLCYVDAGDRLEPGQRYGFIRFGSRVDLYLPVGSTPRVSVGDKVTAAETIMAELPASALSA
ncbi:MAG: phosphatidylserine decarboxylase, partial [Betaproteobacteria bacterium]